MVGPGPHPFVIETAADRGRKPRDDSFEVPMLRLSVGFLVRFCPLGDLELSMPELAESLHVC